MAYNFAETGVGFADVLFVAIPAIFSLGTGYLFTAEKNDAALGAAAVWTILLIGGLISQEKYLLEAGISGLLSTGIGGLLGMAAAASKTKKG